MNLSHQTSAAISTLILGVNCAAVALPVGGFLGRVCARTGIVATLVRAACLAFLFVPLFVHVSAWDSAFGKLGWLASYNFFSRGVENWLLAIWIHAVAAIPQVAVIFWIGSKYFGQTHEEQASLEASSMEIFWQISIWRLMPLIGVSFVWIFVTCSREIAVTDIYRIETIAEQIYLGYSLGEVDIHFHSAVPIALIVFLAALILAASSIWLRQADENGGRRTIRNGAVASPVQSAFAIAIFMVVFLLPVVNLIIRACKFVKLSAGNLVIDYQIAHFASLLIEIPNSFGTEFYWSTIIASVSTVFVSTVSIVLAWKSLESRYWKVLSIAAMAICAGLPGPFIGSFLLSCRNLLDWPWYEFVFDRTLITPTIANFIFCWPIGWVIFSYFLSNTPIEMLENAKLEGASALQRLWLIIRMNSTGIIGAALIIFALCFGELSASQLVMPPGIDTIPRSMLGLLHSGVNDRTATFTLAILIVNLAVICAGWKIASWHRRQQEQKFRENQTR